MRIFTFVLLLFVCSSATSQPSLDGNTYTIKLKVSGPKRLGRDWTTDELRFLDGSFTSKTMEEGEKFPPFQYTVTEDPTSKGVVLFTAEGQNPGGSSITWNGKVKGNKIEGTATWTNRNGPQKQLFKGSLKEKK